MAISTERFTIKTGENTVPVLDLRNLKSNQVINRGKRSDTANYNHLSSILNDFIQGKVEDIDNEELRKLLSRLSTNKINDLLIDIGVDVKKFDGLFHTLLQAVDGGNELISLFNQMKGKDKNTLLMELLGSDSAMVKEFMNKNIDPKYRKLLEKIIGNKDVAFGDIKDDVGKIIASIIKDSNKKGFSDVLSLIDKFTSDDKSRKKIILDVLKSAINNKDFNSIIAIAESTHSSLLAGESSGLITQILKNIELPEDVKEDQWFDKLNSVTLLLSKIDPDWDKGVKRFINNNGEDITDVIGVMSSGEISDLLDSGFMKEVMVDAKNDLKGATKDFFKLLKSKIDSNIKLDNTVLSDDEWKLLFA